MKSKDTIYTRVLCWLLRRRWVRPRSLALRVLTWAYLRSINRRMGLR